MVMGRPFLILCCLTVLGLVLTSCAPGAPPTPTTKPAAPAQKVESPIIQPTVATSPTRSSQPAKEQPRYGGILLTNVNTSPPSPDLHQESTLSVVYSFGACYNSLVKQDPFKVGELIGDLAQRWEVSPDGKVYTFYLSKGVKWHDGQPFSAEDVKFSLDRMRTPPKGTISQRQASLSSIKDIEVVDKDTVRVILSAPHAAFLWMLSTGWEVIMPKHVIESKGSMKKDVVGTGPFKFVSHDSGVGTDLKKNNDYFVKERPYLDGMRVFIITDPTTRFAALRTKRLHMSCQNNGLTPSQSEMIEKEKFGINIGRSEGLGNWQLPVRNDVAPWNDIRVRRAVDLALDRQDAIRVISEGAGTLGGPIPPSSPMAIPQAELAKMPGYRQPKDQDIAEAKRLLAEAGYPNGFDTHVLFRSGAIWEKGAVFFKDQLAKLGIKATLEGKESGTYLNRLFEGLFVVSAYKTATFGAEPEFVLGETYTSGGGKNYSRFNDQEFDRMFEEQRQIMDAAKRKELILRIQYRLLDRLPFVLSHWETFLMGHWPEVKNYLTLTDSYANNKWQEVWLAK